MASPAGGNRRGVIRLDENNLTRNITTLPGMINRAAAFVMMKNEAPVEAHMKTSAPWTDRTSNARNGLVAKYVGSENGVHRMVLHHSVNYGIWLEVRWDGRYAVILPTIEEMGPKVMEDLVGILDRIQASGGGASA